MTKTTKRPITGVALYGGSTTGLDILNWAAHVAVAQGWTAAEATIVPTVDGPAFKASTWVANAAS